MTDILIKGLDLTEDACAINLTIYSNGKVYGSQQVGDSMVRINTTAVELPPHGDLIDVQAIEERAKEIQYERGITYKEALLIAFDEASVVVEATE